MIPACFSQPNSPSTSGISQHPQNLVTSIYQFQLCNTTTYLTLSWSKTLLSHSLTIYSPHTFSITIPLNPPTFSFFRTKPGSKSIYITKKHQKQSQKLKIFWDFSGARFFKNYAEPESCFFLAILCNGILEFFVGDFFPLMKSITNQIPCDYALFSRREHLFGDTNFVSKGVFLGSKHEIEIECNKGVLNVKLDGEIQLVVKRLAWKFRGNEKFFIDGVEVEFYWDVLNWVVNGDENGNNSFGVFVFQVGEGAVWPEMVGQEKRLMKKSLPGTAVAPPSVLSPPPSRSGVLQWAEESSDGGRSSCSSSTRSCGSNGSGFSLLIYAWRSSD